MRHLIRDYRYARHEHMMFCRKACCSGSIKHGGLNMNRRRALRWALSKKRIDPRVPSQKVKSW